MTLGRKQTLSDQSAWRDVIGRAREAWPDARLDRLIGATVDQIRSTVRGRHAAYAWSGGKDSRALEWVCRAAGVDECVLAISELEWPATLRWITDHMPPGLSVVNTGQDLDWLKAHPAMLFPQGADGARWFTIVNHRGQATYYRANRLDVLMLGRRRIDGNYTGPAGQNVYTSKGVTRYSPIASWSHEAVFALLEREGIGLPPCYGWPRGFQVGTGSWPARQWTDSNRHGWEEVHTIDPDVLALAVEHDLPGARAYAEGA